MLLTEYLDTIENTEKEQEFLRALSDIRQELQAGAKIPFIGKPIRALAAIGECESIEEFKQSEHYENITGFDITVSNLEKGHFSIYPGSAQRKKMAKVLAIVIAALLLLRLCKNRRRCPNC